MWNTAKALLSSALFGGGQKPPRGEPKTYPPHVPHQGKRERARRTGLELPPVGVTPRTGPSPTDPDVSRQVRRAGDRAMTADAKRLLRERSRRERAQALLDRQKKREDSGAYDGRLPVAVALACKRAGRLHGRVLKDDTAKAKRGNLVRMT